jgi:hypothetical protein
MWTARNPASGAAAVAEALRAGADVAASART